MVKFIAADLDGTLLDSKKRLPPELGEVIKKLKDRGITFAPASGRQYYNLLKQFEPISRDFMYIAENGAMVVKDNKPVILDCLDLKEAVKAVKIVRDIPTASAIVCRDDYAFAEDESNEKFVYNARMYYEHYKLVDDILNYCDGNVFKIAIFDKEDAEKNVYRQLKEASSGAVILSGTEWVDIMKPGVSKGSALRHIKEIFGWNKEECMAFGDYLNDCEMLDECGFSYAMENAHMELKKHARYTAPSNDDNGVMRVIEEMLGENALGNGAE